MKQLSGKPNVILQTTKNHPAPLVGLSLALLVGAFSPIVSAEERLNSTLTDAVAETVGNQINSAIEEKQARRLTTSLSKPGAATKAIVASKYSSSVYTALTSSKNGKFGKAPLMRQDSKNRVQVDITLANADDATISRLKESGVKVELVNRELKRAQVWATPEQLQLLGSADYVVRLREPRYAHSRRGSVQTEGDAILRSNLVRGMGLTGAGVKVGIISDGANDLATAQASGDLPAGVTRFGNCSKRDLNISSCLSSKTCNEGTAMAEIIHDIAPDAELAVAAVNTDLEFIQRLNQLANSFEADIIVDDLGFFGEPFFEDGPLADAVSALPSRILYVSSAGNSGNTHYEADYEFTPLDGALNLRPHDFGGNGDPEIGFIVPARGFVVPIIQWNTPFDAPASDYDIFVRNEAGLIARGDQDQSAPGANPFEAVCLPNESNTDAVNFALINQFSGTDNRLELFFLGSLAIEYPIAQGSIFGHPGVARAIAVGTINASDPGNNTIAFYSSQGPARIDFPALESRNKPDLTGIDGVRVSGAGGFRSPFFGTSAAAPHVAGVAALLKSASPGVTAISIRRALQNGAVDLGANGFDRVFGHGRVDAAAAKERLTVGVPTGPFLILLDEEEPD